MKRTLILAAAILLALQQPCHAGFLDDIIREILPQDQPRVSLDESTVVKGLKEALAKGTERAVTQVARPDGYFGNQLIKIMLPARVQTAADILATLGYQQQVDEVVLTMNRAAEMAAPKAAAIFADAIRQMSIEDANTILGGGETAATEFFARKTRAKLFDTFKPSVVKSMDQVGTARAYKAMIGKYDLAPVAALAGFPSLDLDNYVTNKALDGLFTMVAAEEKKIRTNPAARTTDLLQQVFGGK